MRRANIIEKDTIQIKTVENLTGVFESIASNHVAKVKKKVDLSKAFFQLLWTRYKSIQIDPSKRITNRDLTDKNDKKVFVIISAGAGLSGDIDQRLIEKMLQDYDEKSTDIIVLGTHGANQLIQMGIKFKRYFQVPESEDYIDVSPLVEAVLPYSKIVIYYEEYVSLGVQEIKAIDLISSLRDMSEQGDIEDEEIISEEDTIFEPSIEEIADQMEITMMALALNQTILESSLAQAASRFSAMAVAKKRASEMLTDYRFEFYRAKRSESDRRLSEVLVGLKKKRRQTGGLC
ncbi:MAG TPA: F0F1 ATP synthase subunit gamma [Candidatus Saccharibacteria bacterium]|nr:F0F1 ATP synthase subunit gamma [Candidatus Saccharibacteria bacterium]